MTGTTSWVAFWATGAGEAFGTSLYFYTGTLIIFFST
jgi:hypothetical protein